MSADQFTDTLNRLQLTGVSAAQLLGVDERTVKRWRYKERKVPPPVARFLRYILLTKADAGEVIALLSRQG
jgi:hypothetical protein